MDVSTRINNMKIKFLEKNKYNTQHKQQRPEQWLRRGHTKPHSEQTFPILYNN